MSASIVWFRNDLRLADNPALTAAVERGAPIVAAYIHAESGTEARQFAARPPGAASRWWLHHALLDLDQSLQRGGNRLVLRRGPSVQAIKQLVDETGAASVFWNRRYDAAGVALDTRIKKMLGERSIDVQSFNAHLLHEPWTVKTQSGQPYRVFTPYWRAARALGEPSAPLATPASIPAQPSSLSTEKLDDWGLLPTTPNWAVGLNEAWVPTEIAAHDRLDAFIDQALTGYSDRRNSPSVDGTSRLSPYLAFGQISPRQIWTRTMRPDVTAPGPDTSKFLAEIGWREFSYHLLFHQDDLATVNVQRRFNAMPWNEPGPELESWKRGKTGYPFIDAAMRQLWQTGWMHNRCRMVVASFLIKHLMIDWRIGERWFWDTLVDADMASNPAGWQWVAGSGADAAPYFRVFNPILQGEKFDPDGEYVRTFVPELARLPNKFVHKPWMATVEILKNAGVTLGETYPRPIIDHQGARQRALAVFDEIKKVE